MPSHVFALSPFRRIVNKKVPWFYQMGVEAIKGRVNQLTSIVTYRLEEGIMIKRNRVSILLTLLISFVMLVGQAKAAQAYDFNNWSTWQLVGVGNTGGFVKAVQSNLWSSGLKDTVGTIDGIFGNMTKSGTITFQQRNGLTADGIVGPQTWGMMQNYAQLTPNGYYIYRGTGLYSNYVVDYTQYSSGQVWGDLYEGTYPSYTLRQSFQVW